MKQCCKVITACVLGLILQLHLMAQRNDMAIQTKALQPYPIAISFNKTSNIIFPYEIISVDKGSSSVLAQKAKGVENILQLKAEKESFAQTNLSVITKDGRFYSFLVDYAQDPAILNFQIVKGSNLFKSDVLLSDFSLNEDIVNDITRQLKNRKRFLHIYTKNQRMKLSMDGIYLKENLMWISFKMANGSFISYRPESIRFFVRDLKRLKRTALQETEIQPLYAQMDSLISGNDDATAVFGFNPFTIPKTQELIVQVAEHNGGRTLVLHVRYAAMLKARLLK